MVKHSGTRIAKGWARGARALGTLAVVAALTGSAVAGALDGGRLAQTMIDHHQLPKSLDCSASTDQWVVSCSDPNG